MKRYTENLVWTGYEDAHVEMDEDKNGKYVLFSDVELFIAERNKFARALLKVIAYKTICPFCGNLISEHAEKCVVILAENVNKREYAAALKGEK